MTIDNKDIHSSIEYLNTKILNDLDSKLRKKSFGNTLKNMMDSMENAYFQPSTSHTDKDLFVIVQSLIANAGIQIMDSWDYYSHKSFSSAEQFLSEAIPYTETEPNLIVIEYIDDASREHGAFFIGTIGFPDDTYNLAIRSFNNKIADTSQLPPTYILDEVIKTEDAGKTVMNFVTAVKLAFPDIVDNNEKDNEVQATDQITTDELKTSLKFTSGFVIYVFGLKDPNFGKEPIPVSQIEIEQPKKEKEMVINTNPDPELFFENINKMLPIPSNKTIQVNDSATEKDIVLFTHLLKEDVGEFYETKLEEDYTRLMFENAIVEIPKYFNTSFSAKVIPLAIEGHEVKQVALTLTSRKQENLSHIVSIITENKYNMLPDSTKELGLEAFSLLTEADEPVKKSKDTSEEQEENKQGSNYKEVKNQANEVISKNLNKVISTCYKDTPKVLISYITHPNNAQNKFLKQIKKQLEYNVKKFNYHDKVPIALFYYPKTKSYICILIDKLTNRTTLKDKAVDYVLLVDKTILQTFSSKTLGFVSATASFMSGDWIPKSPLEFLDKLSSGNWLDNLEKKLGEKEFIAFPVHSTSDTIALALDRAKKILKAHADKESIDIPQDEETPLNDLIVWKSIIEKNVPSLLKSVNFSASITNNNNDIAFFTKWMEDYSRYSVYGQHDDYHIDVQKLIHIFDESFKNMFKKYDISDEIVDQWEKLKQASTPQTLFETLYKNISNLGMGAKVQGSKLESVAKNSKIFEKFATGLDKFVLFHLKNNNHVVDSGFLYDDNLFTSFLNALFEDEKERTLILRIVFAPKGGQ